MKKWAFAFAAVAFVVIGCGGGGGGHSSNNNGGTTGNGDSTAFVSLPATAGIVNITYLTGAGRAAGSPTAIIRRVVLADSFGQIETQLQSELALQLDLYTQQIIRLDVPTTNSRLFDTFFLEIKEMKVDNGDGTFTTIPGPNNQPLVQESFPASIRAFPSRQTSVAIRLDDTMFAVDANAGTATFDRSVFESANLNPETNTINGFLGDYVKFDISNMPATAQPDFTTGGKADILFVSGDNFALGKSDGSNPGHGALDVLTPIGFVEGSYGPPTSIAPFGTYTLVQPDPRDLSGVGRITALQGIWRNLTDVIGNVGTFEVISFPSSSDDNLQDVVLVHRSSGIIDTLYFGQLDLSALTLKAYPIDQIDDGDASNEIDGTLSDLKDKNGAATSVPTLVREGRYTLTNGTGSVPANFKTSGRFIVFRK